MEIMLFETVLTNRGREGLDVRNNRLTRWFLDNNHGFLPGVLHGECGSSSCPEQFMTRLHRAFEVPRVVISASNDQEIFHATGDKDFPFGQTRGRRFGGMARRRYPPSLAPNVRGFVGFVPIASVVLAPEARFLRPVAPRNGTAFRDGRSPPGYRRPACHIRPPVELAPSARASMTAPCSNAAASSVVTVGATFALQRNGQRIPPFRMREKASRWNPAGANASANRSIVSGAMGSAPQLATCQRDKSGWPVPLALSIPRNADTQKLGAPLCVISYR